MAARFPFPTSPSGWFQVGWSDELPVLGVRPLRAFGLDLVAWRGEGGTPHVADAHCPHLGAHLGHGGTVSGDDIRCPFHGWRFCADGGCVEIPRGLKIPAQARLRARPVEERGGLLFVHHDPTGETPIGPVPELLLVPGDRWLAPVRRTWIVRSHVQDISENIVDPAHFHHVHGTSYPTITVEASGPVLRTRSLQRQHTPRGDVDTRLDIAGYGLGVFVARFTGILDVLLVIAPTPVEDERVELRLTYLVDRSGGASSGLGAAFIAEIDRQVEQDIPIWDHKVHRPTPPLTAVEGTIVTFRRWARQFYPEA